nr:zinc finger, CCHC-type [Tanacetum cinerariifolium]
MRPLGGHFKLSLKDYPVRDCDVKGISKVPYANAVGSLTYLMVCTRPDIAYASYAPDEYIYLLFYEDDMLITCKSKAEIGSTKSLLKKEFDMKELREVKKILGMKIAWDRSRKILRVSQSGPDIAYAEIKERFKAKGDDGKGLYVRGRTDRRDSRSLEEKCPKNNRKKSTGYVKIDEQPSSSGSTYDDSEVMMVMSAQAVLDWIMDSGCSYHMTPKLDILFDFLECDGGSVQLGDNREYKIRGIDLPVLQIPPAGDLTHDITYHLARKE